MGRKIAGEHHENMPPLVSIAPDIKLPDTGFEHLVGIKASVRLVDREGDVHGFAGVDDSGEANFSNGG